MSEKNIFNGQSRASSMMKISGVGTACRLLNIIAGFVYRTAFIYLLSERYLGINGLFWDIFRLFALAELGIGSAICYRFYEPIARGNVTQVGRLMGFFKSVYLLIAGVILVLGLSVFPFLGHLIRDMGEVPSDVNLQVVYLLFLFQSVSTYLFSYRLSIWAADRKDYVTIFTSQTVELGRYGSQLAMLWLTHDFTLTLFVGIAFTLGTNFLLSVWTTRCYAPVFAVTEKLPRAERVQIFKDALALMLHRIGGTVVSSTDSIVISKFVGLAAVGLFSNYALLFNSLVGIVRQMIGGFTSNFGKAYATEAPEALYLLFRRMMFLSLGFGGFCAVMFHLLIGPFIALWLGDRMRLGGLVEAVMAIQVFDQVSWIVIGSHIMASGLFNRDRPRPIIESVLNLGISIALVRVLGLVGVFIGTLVASGLTAFWRAPYLLFSTRFHCSVWRYWRQYAVMTLLPLAFAFGVRLFVPWSVSSWLGWIGVALAFATAYVVLFVACYGWTQDFRFLCQWIDRRVLHRKEAS